MKIQVYSDLHLEFCKNYPRIESNSEILILAGDIGYLEDNNYKNFFDYVSKNWKLVFYVLGNHEFYSDYSIEHLKIKYNDFFSKYDNIKLLDREICYIDDILVIGATLWSQATYKTTKVINDFKKIKLGEKINMNKDSYNLMNKNETEFIIDNIEKSKCNKIIVITHYPLIYVQNPKYPNDPSYLKNYFNNNISLKTEKNVVCVSGHTHQCFDIVKNNIRYISNQFGYKNEISKNLKIDGVYEIFK